MGPIFVLAMQMFVYLFLGEPNLGDKLMFYHVSQDILIYFALILKCYRARHFRMLDDVVLAPFDDLKVAEPF